MKVVLNIGALSLSAVLLALPFAPFGQEGAPHRLGDHPAVIVQRLQKTATYDYASKFYPHPAWLRLYAAPPGDGTDAVGSP